MCVRGGSHALVWGGHAVPVSTNATTCAPDESGKVLRTRFTEVHLCFMEDVTVSSSGVSVYVLLY